MTGLSASAVGLGDLVDGISDVGVVLSATSTLNPKP